MTSRTTAKGNYQPRGRVWVICPICEKRFSVNGAEYRHRVKKHQKNPCCSRECGTQQRKNNSHKE